MWRNYAVISQQLISNVLENIVCDIQHHIVQEMCKILQEHGNDFTYDQKKLLGCVTLAAMRRAELVIPLAMGAKAPAVDNRVAKAAVLNIIFSV